VCESQSCCPGLPPIRRVCSLVWCPETRLHAQLMSLLSGWLTWAVSLSRMGPKNFVPPHLTCSACCTHGLGKNRPIECVSCLLFCFLGRNIQSVLIQAKVTRHSLKYMTKRRWMARRLILKCLNVIKVVLWIYVDCRVQINQNHTNTRVFLIMNMVQECASLK